MTHEEMTHQQATRLVQDFKLILPAMLHPALFGPTRDSSIGVHVLGLPSRLHAQHCEWSAM